ncbi:MAG: metallophosphoesterase family protein [Geitlerinemataceae cyanobacterium]
MRWAILSGIEGNLPAYEAVLEDIKRQREKVDELFVIGDSVGLQGDNEATIKRLRAPKPGELNPQVCIGWWEEQCFCLHGLSGLPDAPELVAKHGVEGAEALWKSVSRESVAWMRSCHFGFFESGCLLIHGSTMGYADELTPETPAIQLCDRLIRADANALFCGRSGRTFECWVTPEKLRSTVTTLDEVQEPKEQGKTPRRVVGVGSVGHEPGQASYALYDSVGDEVTFRTVAYGRSKGFG